MIKKVLGLIALSVSVNSFADVMCTYFIRDHWNRDVERPVQRISYSRYAACDAASYDCEDRLRIIDPGHFSYQCVFGGVMDVRGPNDPYPYPYPYPRNPRDDDRRWPRPEPREPRDPRWPIPNPRDPREDDRRWPRPEPRDPPRDHEHERDRWPNPMPRPPEPRPNPMPALRPPEPRPAPGPGPRPPEPRPTPGPGPRGGQEDNRRPPSPGDQIRPRP
jgi:hypothetical protein